LARWSIKKLVFQRIKSITPITEKESGVQVQKGKRKELISVKRGVQVQKRRKLKPGHLKKKDMGNGEDI